MPWDDCAASILGLLRKYHERFSFSYAAAITYAEQIPEQVNNEIRNALTHLSRAATVDDQNLAQAEIDKASSHFERAVRDCYKLAVININDLIQKALRVLDVTRNGVTASTARNYDELRKVRRRIAQDEQKSATGTKQFQEITKAYEDLFRSLVYLYDTILEDYHLTEDKIRCFPRWWRTRKICIWLFSLVVAFLVGVLTNHYTDGAVRAFASGWQLVVDALGIESFF